MSTLRSLPPLDALRGFVAASRRLSISLAAQDLCLTQSAVSRQIQSLEERLGVQLFIRRHRSLELTDAGEQLFQLCSPWMNKLATFTERVKREGGMRPVTITASMGVAALWLLPRLGKFQAENPSIDVRVAANNRLLDLKVEGIDLAIRYGKRSEAPTDATFLFGEHVVPVAHEAIAQRAFTTGRGVLNEVLLDLDDKGRPWLSWSGWLQEKGMADTKPRGYLHFNQYDQLIQAALEGHGIALGRVPLVLPMLRDGRLVAQPNGVFEIEHYGYWLIDSSGNRRGEVETFRDWILAEVRKDYPAGGPPVPDLQHPEWLASQTGAVPA